MSVGALKETWTWMFNFSSKMASSVPKPNVNVQDKQHVHYKYMYEELYAWQVCSPVTKKIIFVQFYEEWKEWLPEMFFMAQVWIRALVPQ